MLVHLGLFVWFPNHYHWQMWCNICNVMPCSNLLRRLYLNISQIIISPRVYTGQDPEDLEKAIPADQIKSFRNIYKGYDERSPLFFGFLLQPSEGEGHVDGKTVLKSALRFWVDFLH